MEFSAGKAGLVVHSWLLNCGKSFFGISMTFESECRLYCTVQILLMIGDMVKLYIVHCSVWEFLVIVADQYCQ